MYISEELAYPTINNWRQQVPMKRQDTLTRTRSATSQKAVIYVGEAILTEILMVLSVDP